MFLVQLPRSLAGVPVAGQQTVERGRREDLAAAEQVSRGALRVGPVDRGALVLRMQHEPELDARVGQRDVDPPGLGEPQRTGDTGMLIDVEDAPVLTVGRAPASPGAALVGGLAGRGPLHQPQRRPVKGVDGEVRPFGVQPVPAPQVTGLGPQPLGEDKERASLAGRTGALLQMVAK
jgi:hypothetical protein